MSGDWTERGNGTRRDEQELRERERGNGGSGEGGGVLEARSDERIRKDVLDRLAEGQIDVRAIEVTVRDGEVTLTGTVVEREAKRMAEELVEHIPGVLDVHNQIRVRLQITGE